MARQGRRTTHRSRTGTTLDAVRDAKDRFTDIQTYTRVERQTEGELTREWGRT